MKRMLVNATQQEELRVAMVDGQRIYDLDIEVPSREQRKANIYKGRITRLEPSLEAAFVDYGAERHGFLPLKEISREYFLTSPPDGERIQIKDVLKEGQEIVVQVEKEERGNKGAALTTFVSLAGRFIVLMPNNPRAGGVSRRITGEDRDIVRESLEELAAPSEMGCIIRTAGVGRSIEELKWDLDYLLSVWESIKTVVVTRPAPFLIYQEGSAIVRALRDHFSSEIGEILIDDERVYQEASDFMERVIPHNVKKLKKYEDTSVPLFTRFQIESQIESAFSHQVSLPSGGSIVIDHTEALTAIDINSARATKGGDIEATALNTNLEAAEEIGRQMRLRDMGGLVVVDFIDMGPNRNQREVENKLKEAVRTDRARVQIGRISRFGLLELSRQRLRPSLEESTQSVCPRCNGLGNVRSVESLALAILRLLGEEARKDRTAKVIAQLPVEVGNYLLNEKRDWVQNIQDSNGVSILLVSNAALETPNYVIRRVRDDETTQAENVGASYRLSEQPEDGAEQLEALKPAPKPDMPAVSGVLPTTPAPSPAEKKQAKRPGRSIWQVLFGWLSSKQSARKTASDTRRRGPRGKDARRSRKRRAPRQDSRDRSGRNKRATADGGGKEKAARPQKQQAGQGRKRQRRRKSGGAQRKQSADAAHQAAATGNSPQSDAGAKQSHNDKHPQQPRTADTERQQNKVERNDAEQPKAEPAGARSTTRQQVDSTPAATPGTDDRISTRQPDREQQDKAVAGSASAADRIDNDGRGQRPAAPRDQQESAKPATTEHDAAATNSPGREPQREEQAPVRD